MAQDTTQRADEQPREQQEPFSNKPQVLADNGRGTKVKLWTNKNKTDGTEFQTLSIERSFKRQGSETWETQKVTVNGDDALLVARALEKGHDAIVERQTSRQQTAAHA